MASEPPFRTAGRGTRVIQGTFQGGKPRMVAAHHVAKAVQAALRPSPALPSRPGPASRIIPPPVPGGRPTVQARSASPGSTSGGAVEVGHVLDLGRRGPGQPLPAELRQVMEGVLQADLSDVRVHQGPEAGAIGALAFAYGSDLYFAPGRYDPGSPHGRRLIAHELTHVVQQKTARVRNPLGGGLVIVQDAGLEAEAERVANGIGRFTVQPKVAQPSARHSARYPPRQPGGPVQLARNPAASRVIQRLSFRSTATNTVFRVSQRPHSKGTKIEVEDTSGNSAYLIYNYYGNVAVVLSLEGEDMKTGGTRVSYLLINIFAQQARRAGKTTVELGTAVYLKEDASEQDEPSRKAAFVYGQLGFDVSSAVAASRSSVSVDQVISRTRAKIGTLWAEVDDSSASATITTPLVSASSSSSSSSSQGCRCFLVTACARVRGLPEDCEELAELRAFRDSFMSQTAERRALVELYYQIAPGIVAAIDAGPDALEEYAAIYAVVAECMELIAQSRDAEALGRYRALVEGLAAHYTPSVEPKDVHLLPA